MTAPTDDERFQRYAEAVVRGWNDDGAVALVMAVADAELRRERVARIGDDSIRSMELKAATRRAETAEAKVAAALALHARGDEGHYDDHCEACECWWPCPTAVALGVPDRAAP